jgi:hypothetical protein
MKSLTLGLVATTAVASPIPTPIGIGPRYHPPPAGRAVEHARPVGDLSCRGSAGRRFGVHLELFANRRVVVVPAGIGIAPPRRTKGVYVVGGRCSYAARTREPTGVVEVRQGMNLRLGQLFALWGQSLGRSRLGGFTAARGTRVLAFVDGRSHIGDPRLIPLRRHAEIVLEVGGFVPPHTSYRFPKGL